MNKKLIVAVCLLFLASRIFFINTQPLFFDSAEYMKALAVPNLFDAIIAVHFPLHDGYIWLLWPFYHFAKFISVDPVYTVILVQTMMAGFIIYFFYQTLLLIADKKTALIAASIISLTPLFWISNVTILYEIAYLFLFFTALFFLSRYIQTKHVHFLYLSAVFLPLAIFTHMMLSLWVPLYFAILFINARKHFFRDVSIVIVCMIVLTIVRTVVINNISYNNYAVVINNLYLGNFSNAASFSFDVQNMLVYTRNFIIPLIRGFTSLVTILAIASLVLMVFKQRTYFVYALLWTGPAVLALQFWEAQLPGRYAILAGFGIAFLAAYLIRNSRIAIMTVIVYLLFVSIPALNLLREDIPYIKLAEYTQSLPSNSLLIESHFSRRQVQDFYQGKLLSINEPNISLDEIKREVDSYLAQKRDIYVSSPALTDPYGLYSGPYLHILSLSYSKPAELKSLLPEYTLELHEVIDKQDNLYMYKIVSNKNGPYPQIRQMKDHYRRIDYFDPLWRLYRLTGL